MTGGVGLPNDDPSCYARLEVGGSRASKGVRGSTTPGSEFVIDTLVIGPGAHVSLVDLSDNGNRLECPSGKIIDESLTVNHLVFEDEARRLNTSGLNFSYQQLDGLKSQIITLAPEPVDFDADGDVDLIDVQHFLNCLPMTPLDYGCRVFDANGDDLLGAGEFQELLDVFTGPLVCPNTAP